MVDEHFFRRHEDHRCRHIPQVDLIVQREKEVANEQRLSAYFCSCKKCHGGRRQTLRSVDIHRERYGRDEHLMFSMLGGDPPGGYPRDRIWVGNNKDVDDEENVFDDAEGESLYDEQMDPYHDV